ncbi:MAG: response regulator transcription factor [Bacteroidota bacterium]
MKTPVRIVLADDHPSVRAGLRTAIEAQPDLEVVGEASDGPGALAMVRDLDPDVLVLDMRMPGQSGVEVARTLQEAKTRTRILAVSAYDDEAYVQGLLTSGAAGYITKEKPVEVIVEAVRAVARGEGRWFVRPTKPDDPPITRREQDVLRLMAMGETNDKIALALGLSENTIRNHIGSIYAKLGVHSYREAIAWAWKHGFADE